MTRSTDANERANGTGQAAGRRLLTIPQLLDIARSDPDLRVREVALAACTDLQAPGTDDAVVDEILAWCRDVDPERQRFGLEFLGSTGARGAALGRELIDQGGIAIDVYHGAVKTLVAARRFDHLVAEGLGNDGRHDVVEILQSALDDDASIATHVAGVLRSMEPPAKDDGLDDFVNLAVRAGARDVLHELATARGARADVAAAAIVALLADDDGRQAGLELAEEALTGAASTAQHRREVLDHVAEELCGLGEPGLTVLRRVTDHDANPRIRAAAALHLREAGQD